jgi:CheY-like chemotaxis protein
MGRRLKIVVADDERDTREYLGELLGRLGHDVRTAEDGRQVVEAGRDYRPDLVITDYAMPELDGWAVALEVNRDRHVPVILITARYDVDSRVWAEGSPVLRVLAKPVSEAELLAALESALAYAEQ